MYLQEPFLLSYLICLLFISACVSPSSFDFIDFSQVDTESQNCERFSNTVCLQGDAAIVDRGIISLTNQSMWLGAGRAHYSEPLVLYDNTTGELTSFTTTFALEIDSMGQPLQAFADSVAFFLAAYPSKIPPKYNHGGYMALVSQNNWVNAATRSPFVAIEFDSWCDPEYDPSVPHMGIDINNISSVRYANITDYLLKRGAIANVTVAFDGATHNLSVEFLYGDVSLPLWYEVDLRQILPQRVSFGFSAGTGNSYQMSKIHSWRFNTSYNFSGPPSSTYPLVNNTYLNDALNGTNPRPEKKGLSRGILAAIVCSAIVLIITIFGGVCMVWKRTRTSILDNDNDSIDEELENEKGSERFPYIELARATNDFIEEKKLGCGGFGAVYRGFLDDRGIDVAIKRISKDSRQGKKEYISEVKVISQLRHRNLVRLIGWCHQNHDLLLVYEFMSNGSLDNHLFSIQRLLAWPIRYKIACGLASALLYLQEEWEQCVVHRDVKSSNVLLDSEFNAKLGDFGLARTTNHESTLHTTFVAGTLGYLAPECLMGGKGSKESDVYSFGIVALEIACGRKVIEQQLGNEKEQLVNWVWGLYGNNELLEAVDERLHGTFDREQTEQLMLVGMWCAHPDLQHRPSMKQVIRALNFELVVPTLPTRLPEAVYYAFTPPVTANDVRANESNTSLSTTTASSSSKNVLEMSTS